MGSETRGIQVRGLAVMGGAVGSVYGTILGAGTRDGISMVSLHCPNRSRRSLIVSSWALQVTAGTSVESHLSMDMAYMMPSTGVREGCSR